MADKLTDVINLEKALAPTITGQGSPKTWVTMTPMSWKRVDLGFHASIEVCTPVSVTVKYDEAAKEYAKLFDSGKTGTSNALFVRSRNSRRGSAPRSTRRSR